MQLLTIHLALGRPVTASIQCIDCAWSAMLTGENAIEVSIFLRRLYQQHLADRHPGLTFVEDRPS